MKSALIGLLVVIAAHSQLLSSHWSIDSNETSPWEQYGLIPREGLCSWAVKELSQNIELDLYHDYEYSSYLHVKVYLNYSINKAFPFYDGLAHA
jgi:hypothetical protein